MVRDLLKFIKEFKSKKEFDGVDFEGDLVVFYGEIRKMMSINFDDSDFGPVTVSECPKPLQDIQTEKFYFAHKRSFSTENFAQKCRKLSQIIMSLIRWSGLWVQFS